jgi:hypothetical protein
MADHVFNDTVFPKGATKDIALQRRVIEEKWRRFFPQIVYYSMKISTTVASPVDAVVGEAGSTPFDPIYGEALPHNIGAAWKQPHKNTSTLDSTERGVFRPSVVFNGRMQREALDLDLKRWGFDRIRDLIVFIPRTFVETANITNRGIDPLKPGDWFTWDGDPYDVVQRDKDGWWKNTNVRLFYVLNCEHRKLGA